VEFEDVTRDVNLRGHGRSILVRGRMFINAECDLDPKGGRFTKRRQPSEFYLLASPIIAHLSAGQELPSLQRAPAGARSTALQQNLVRPTTDLRAAENLWPQGLRAKTGVQGHDSLWWQRCWPSCRRLQRALPTSRSRPRDRRLSRSFAWDRMSG